LILTLTKHKTAKYYLTDTSHNIISDMQAYHADRVYSKNLQDIVERTRKRLEQTGLLWITILADAGYSNVKTITF